MNIIIPSSHESARRFSGRSLPPLPPPSPLDSAGPAPTAKHVVIRKWPDEAQSVSHGGFFAVFGYFGNALTVVVSCAFFAFGAFVLRHDGVPTTSVPHLSILRDAARYGPTVFPIFLEAIVGQAVHALALWRLEHGERMKVLDQLLGSTSIFATVITQLKYRNIGLLGTLLLLLWSLSPIGGQASLRVLDFGTATAKFNQTMHFIDMNSTFCPADMGYIGELEGMTSTYTLHSLYGAALLAPFATKMSPMDSWGNVKIPMIERLSNLTKDSEGWQQVGNDNKTIFSSLVGIPVTALPLDRHTTFSMETSYFLLDCPILEKSHYNRDKVGAFANGSQIPAPGWDGLLGLSWSLATPEIPFNSSRMFGNATNMAPRRLYYDSIDDGSMINSTYAECTMNTTYVEARTSCYGKNCTVTHIRPSTKQHLEAAWTLIDSPRIAGGFISDFAAAVDGNSYKPTAVQRYLWDPQNPFNMTPSGLALYKLDKTDFATRFAQLLNSYWMAGIGLNLVPGGLPTDSPGGPVLQSALRNGSQYGTQVIPAVATISKSTPVLVCNKPWLAALFVATGIMLLTGVLGLILEFSRKTPDLAVNLSSLTRDNPYIHLPPGGSTLDSATRGRLLQNVRIRFGDVRAEEQVGYLAIASCEKGDEEVVGRASGEVRVEKLKGGKERVFA